MLKLMRDTGKTFAQLTDCIEIYPQINQAVAVREKKPLEEMRELCKAEEECRRELGEEGRTLIRYSGTENKLRLLVECRDEKIARQWMDKLAVAVEADMAGV